MARTTNNGTTTLLPPGGGANQASGQDPLTPHGGGNQSPLPPPGALLPPPPGGSVRATPFSEEPNESEAPSPTPSSGTASTASADATADRPGVRGGEWEGRARALLGPWAEAVHADDEEPLRSAEYDLRKIRGGIYTHNTGKDEWQLTYEIFSAVLDMARRYRATPAPASRVSDRIPWWIDRRSYYLIQDVEDLHGRHYLQPRWLLHGDDWENPHSYEPAPRGRKHPKDKGWTSGYPHWTPLNVFEGTQEELWARYPSLLAEKPPAPTAQPSRPNGRIVRRSRMKGRA